jgi:hypothetical protein
VGFCEGFLRHSGHVGVHVHELWHSLTPSSVVAPDGVHAANRRQ